MTIHECELEIVRSSILEIQADAIVNAANTAMRGGGALDGAIHRAAGPQMKRELEIAAPNGSQTAEVVVTRAYDLPQKWVFHVAGPVWKPSKALECGELLAQSYRNCLQQAQRRELESLAFPIERTAPIALQTAVDFLTQNPQTTLRRVTFALFGGTEFHYFAQAFARLNP